MNYFKHYKKVISVLTIIGLFVAGIQLGFSPFWVSCLVPCTGILLLLLYLFTSGKVDREELAFWDLKEFEQHQSQDIDSLEDIFVDERGGDDFALKIRLSGTLTGAEILRAPFSGQECCGYKLTVGLLRARDSFQRQPHYTNLLLRQVRTTVLTLHQEEKSCFIQGEPLLNLRNSTSQAISWSGLSHLPQDVKNKIDEALKLQNITRAAYTGVLIMEELLIPASGYTIYGICRKVGKKLQIEGNTIVNHPECLYITSYSQTERQYTLKQLKRKMSIRKLVIFPLVLALAAAPGLFFFDYFTHTRGRVSYLAAPVAYKLELENPGVTGEGKLFWVFDGSAGMESTKLTSQSGTELIVQSATQVRISRQYNQTQQYTFGVDEILHWNESFWSLEFEGQLPEQRLRAEALLENNLPARIYIKNPTTRDVKVFFLQAAGEITADQTWSWNAGDGSTNDYGNYAIFYTEDDNPDAQRDVLLVPGDVILLKAADVLLRSFVIGYSAEIVRIQKGWYLQLDDAMLEDKHGELFVKNPSTSEYMLYLLDFGGEYRYGNGWSFNAGEGTDFETGKYLIKEWDDGTNETVTCSEGMQLKVVQTHYELLWEGDLGQCPYAEYTLQDRSWEILIE